MFKELGEFITRRPWVVIALWAAILIVMAPFAANLQDHLQYSGSSFMPKDTDSSRAQDVYDQQFSTGNKSELIVVIETGDHARARAFIDAMNRSVQGNSSLKQFNDTASIYGMQRSTLVEMTPDMHKGLVDAQDNVSDANHKLYDGIDGIRNASDGLYWLWDNVTTINDGFNAARKQIREASAGLYAARDQIVQGHDGLYQIKGAVDVLIGVPAYFAQAYAVTDGGLDDANRSSLANSQTQAYISSSVPPGPGQDMAQLYLAAFYGYWTGHYNGDPWARAQEAISNAGPGFIGGLPEDQRPLMLAIVGNYRLSDYPAGERDFCVNTAAGVQNITDPAQKQMMYALYDLGPSPTAAAIDDLVIGMAAREGGVDRGSIAEIYYLGRNPSDGAIGDYLVNKAVSELKNSDEGKNMSRSDLQNVTDLIRDAWNIGPAATKQDFDNYVLTKAKKGLNASEKETVQEIWDMGPHPNDTAIIDFALAQAAKNGSMNQSQLDAARDIIALGRNASNDSIQAYLVKETMKEMNTTGNGSYYLAVMNLDRNASNATLKAFGAGWADTHDFDDPRLFPESLTNSMVSGNLTLFIVTLNADDIADQYLIEGDVAVLRSIIADVKDRGGFTDVNAYVTGNGAMNMDTDQASNVDMDNIDKYTILLVLVLLLIYFRSVLTPFVPLLAIVIAIVATLGVVCLVSYFIDLYYIVEMFTVIIMLGAGIDYCVFLLSRYAEERREGADVKSSVIATVEHAGKSIVSSGMTAALGFGSLALVANGMFLSMGLGVAIGLMISVAMCITLIPAALTLVGDRIFWPNKIYNTRKNATMTGIWGGIAKKVVRHAKAIVLLAILISVPTVILATQLQTGMDAVQMLPANVESGTGYRLLLDSMGSGAMSRTMITVTLPMYINDSSGNRSPEALDRIEAISSLVAGVPDVDNVYSMTRPDGERINYTDLDDYKGIEKEYYKAYMDNSTGRDNRTTVIYASFRGSPYANEAFDAIARMRMILQNNSTGALQGTEVHVGGESAIFKDLAWTMVDGFFIVLPIVVIGIILILLVLLRSALTPLRIVLTLGMSIIWTIAAYVVIYQYGMGSIMIFMLPILLFIALMGMGVDYDIFLITRMREEKLKGLSNEESIVKAVDRTGTIISLCGAVMAGAFGTLMLSNQLMMQQMGFILFVAIALDATIMRLVIVPAMMIPMGKYNWWLPGQKEKEETPVVALPEKRDTAGK
jgi:RND superfamily putative drug exporter